ncbi:DUF308 domain-containing protein [Microbacterium sp. ARD32]|uniref:HdeD family acid-resistance protein n=1 Tax=Microbacterium sp. ARD32 TaxID=2962577 RepID=UPI0028828B39|nr:DUF308 domain-containing protein [Microbacterium sp. ARD32]MDT0157143.1 DUF308 domain-containing protein [Microbacterium sp. ARD32]
MSHASPALRSLRSAVRSTLVVSGVVMLLLGAFILLSPTGTAMLFAGVLAAYLIVQGLIHLGAEVFSPGDGGRARIARVVLGALYVVAGIVAFVCLLTFTTALTVFFGVLLGITWIVDGVIALSLRSGGRAKLWTVVHAILSIVAGIVLVLSPLYVIALWWLAGIALVALGALQIARAIMLGRDAAPAVPLPSEESS